MILPDVAEGFAKAGRSSTDLTQAAELRNKAKDAMVLVDNPNYIPTSLKTSIIAKIERIAEDIAFIDRRINEGGRVGEGDRQDQRTCE